MSLNPGIKSIRSNVATLMEPPVSLARKRAIMTIAKNNNISFEAAQFRQAQRIATAVARKS